MSPARHVPAWVAYAVLAVMPLAFSSNLVIGRAAMETMTPATLAFWRWFLAFLILLPFAATLIRRHRDAIIAALPILVLLAFLGTVICGTFVYVSLTRTTATNATLIYTTPPIFIIILERIFRGRLMGAAEATGVSLAIAGVVWIVLAGDPASLLTVSVNPGDLGILAASVSWAVYSVVLKHPKIAVLPTQVVFTLVAGLGSLLILPAFLTDAVTTGFLPQGGRAWASIFGVALFASVIAFSAYQFGVKQVGPTVTGIFLYLLPPYGVGMSVLFLGETFHVYHAIGMAFVMAGVILATLPRPMLLGRFAARIPGRDSA